MKQHEFVAAFKDDWEHYEQELTKLEGYKRDISSDFPALFRRLSYHLALAKDRCYSASLVNALNELVIRGHQVLYGRKGGALMRLFKFASNDFPVVVRQYWALFLVSVAVFLVPAVAAWYLVKSDPEYAARILGSGQATELLESWGPNAEGDEDTGCEITHGGVSNRPAYCNMVMFGVYIFNNIGLDFRTFSSGLTAGVGTVYISGMNGFTFGTIWSHLDSESAFHVNNLTAFAVGHGSFELLGLVFSTMGGFLLGGALIRPGRRTRIEALKYYGKPAMQILFGAFMFTAVAAFIEAFWSSKSTIDMNTKFWIGGFGWLLCFLYLALAGKKDAT